MTHAANVSDFGHNVAAGKAGDWKERIGRVGLVGQGIVATVIGLLTIRLAMGDKVDSTTNNGAIQWVAHQRFGKFLLIALTVSLFALAIWRILDAFMGDPVEGSELKDRVKYAVLGFIYLSFAMATLGVTIANWTGSGDTSGSGKTGDEGSQKAAKSIFEWPAGRWLVAIGGIAVIGFGIYTFYKEVITKKFTERLDADDRSWVVRMGQVGYAAQSLVYMVVGYFFVEAAIAFDAKKAKGPSGAVLELAGKGWGQWLLWAIAVGLFAYGIFCIAEAKYRSAA
jgi:hypothetical protein